ncbi:stress-induced protein YchH [Serratia marcescens]|uniref:stress-induced protein YchH n=1 Tax=Serratia marcescens TaxID=615 RepID=UPI0027DAC11C|nr:stress-induced protein YchH [Serratia marcescens]
MGSFLMGRWLGVMIWGASYSIIAEVSQFNLPQFFAHGAIMSIFVGALLWLVGARIGGREQVADRYWWVKHFDKRCRNDQHRSSH